MIRKHPSPTRDHIQITFELPASIWADRIYLVGEFNDWNPRATPLHCSRNGIWRVTLDLPVGRRYEFRYLIDGRWCTDHHADGCVMGACESMNSYVDTRLPAPTHINGTGHGMVHDSHPEAVGKPPPDETDHRHLRPRTPANGRARKHALQAAPKGEEKKPVQVNTRRAPRHAHKSNR